MSTGVGTRPEAVPAEVFQCTSLKQQAFVFSNSSGCSIFAADNPGGTEQRKRTWQPKPENMHRSASGARSREAETTGLFQEEESHPKVRKCTTP